MRKCFIPTWTFLCVELQLFISFLKKLGKCKNIHTSVALKNIRPFPNLEQRFYDTLCWRLYEKKTKTTEINCSSRTFQESMHSNKMIDFTIYTLLSNLRLKKINIPYLARKRLPKMPNYFKSTKIFSNTTTNVVGLYFPLKFQNFICLKTVCWNLIVFKKTNCMKKLSPVWILNQ